MRVDQVTRRPGRLFTFGCSMTSYYYPTWADIIGRDWEYHENWGRPGAGNSCIFNSIMECHSRNQFTENDTVLVMWSGIARIDGYQYNSWAHHHSIFPSDSEFASCPKGYEILSYAWMYSVDQILNASPCQYHAMSWVDYDLDDDPGKVFGSTISKIKKISFPQNRLSTVFDNSESFHHYWQDLYDRLSGPDWPTLEKIRIKDINGVSDDIKKEIEEFQNLIDQDKRWKHLENTVDTHPTPAQHLDVIKKYFPYIILTESTKSWALAQDKEWISGKHQKFNKSSPKERL